MPRLLRSAGSLAIVLVVYWTYSLLAVPLIEPGADLAPGDPISKSDRIAAQELVIARVKQFEGLFPPDAWELKSPMILESERVKLLMQEHHNLGDGRMTIVPCTVIFTPDETVTDPVQRKRQVVILEAPQGAMLQFDAPLDLRRVKIGRLIGGKLNGPITIRSDGKKPGPEDDFLITTRDVELSEQRVWTQHRVDFRLGPNYGRGSHMQITLLPRENPNGPGGRGPNIGGIETFQLQCLERLHLELDQKELMSDDKPSEPADKSDSALPVEVTCRGPFRFDVPRKVATFEDRVDVLRINPNGPSDQLNCELLSIFFVDRKPADSGGSANTNADTNANPKIDTKTNTNAKPGGPFDLQPQRIEARGDPVVVSAPTEQAHARGQHLEYDLQSRRIVLDGTREVFLQQGANEIHARSLQYQYLGRERLGPAVAEGPGWLRAQMDDRPDEQLEARWNERLEVQPDGPNQVISLSGAAHVKFRDIGQLDAGEVHLWLLEIPPQSPSEKLRLEPDRMMARGDVRVNSPQLSTMLKQLEIWFEHAPDPEQSTPKPQALPSDGGQGDAPGAAAAVPSRAGAPAPSVSRLPPTGPTASATGTRRQHFQIGGRLLRARLLVQQDQEAELLELMVEDDVSFVETQTAEPGETPLRISGDRLHAVDASLPHAAVTITGAPAHFRGRDLALTGPNIKLNRGTNQLSIDGPGQMDLPLDRDLKGRPLRTPGKLNVQWQKSMEFDGRIAQFEDQVVATGPQQTLWTETLEVQLRRKIRFTDPELPQDSKAEELIEQILCRGGVSMESRSFRGQTQTSYERMQVTDLSVHLVSGALTAGGPGWLVSVHRGSADLLGGLGAMAPTSGQDAPGRTPSASSDALRCLEVHFLGSITGDVLRREMTFHDQVRTAYARVDSWDATLDVDDPDTLGPGGAALRCDRLSVVEMETPAGTHRELEASGNVVAEGKAEDDAIFIARAIRMTFDEAKNLLILEGDGRIPAELIRQQQLGGPMDKKAARKISYWPKTKWSEERLNVDGARSLEINRFPTSSSTRR